MGLCYSFLLKNEFLSWYLAFCSIYFIILSYSRIGYIKVNKLINAHNLTFYPNVSKSQSKYCHFDGNLELIVISLLYLIVTLSFQCFVTIYFRVKKLSTTLRRISSLCLLQHVQGRRACVVNIVNNNTIKNKHTETRAYLGGIISGHIFLVFRLSQKT